MFSYQKQKMRQDNWTSEKEDFLIKNYQVMKDKELAEALGLNEYVIQNRLRKLGLKRDYIWSEEKITHKIQKLAQAGIRLNDANIRRAYPDLYYAACKKNYFKKWSAAVEAAGYNYTQYTLRNEYTDASFIKEIRSMHESGHNLLRKNISKVAPRLIYYGERHYHTWGNVLKKAGFSAADIKKWEDEETQHTITLLKSQIKEKILSYYRKGIALNSANICRIDPVLYRLARRAFRTWEEAIIFSGLNYDEVLAIGKQGITNALKKWNKEAVIQGILKLYHKGLNIHASNLKARYGNIYAAAIKYFGNLENAITACGLDYSRINLRSDEIKWNKDKIIQEIKKLHSQNIPLYYQNIKSNYPKLCAAAHSHYKSWATAITAAGFNYSKIKRKNDAYTIEDVQNIIRKLAAEGVDLSYSGLKGTKYAGMVVAAARLFNGWHNALASVGIQYSEIQKKRPSWTKEEIVTTIKELASKGVDLSFAGMKNSKYAGMVQVTRKKEFFGSWANAIKAAGLHYASICKNRNTESARGLALQRTFEKSVSILNLPLHPQVRGFRFNDELCIPDFVDTVTGAWVDVKIHSWSGGIDNTVKKYLKHVNELWIYYLLGSHRQWPDKRVQFKAIKDFFPDLKRKRRTDLIKKFDEISKTNADTIVFDTWAKRWNRKKVLSTIKERYENGLSINARDIQNEFNGLYKAAVKYFKSWPLAIKAAGIDYDQIKYFDEWSPDQVKEEIRKLYSAGEDLSHTGIREKYPTLLWAAIRYFETWSKAVEICDINYSQFLRQEKWTKEGVITDLKGLINQGADLSYTGMRKRHPKLLVAAERYFGTWREALNFLGVDYSTIRRQRKWTPNLVITEITNLINTGVILRSHHIERNYRPLFKAAKRYFNSWHVALATAMKEINKNGAAFFLKTAATDG